MRFQLGIVHPSSFKCRNTIDTLVHNGVSNLGHLDKYVIMFLFFVFNAAQYAV